MCYPKILWCVSIKLTEGSWWLKAIWFTGSHQRGEGDPRLKLLGKYPIFCKSILSLDSQYCHIITFQLFRSKLVSESKRKDWMPWWNWSLIIQFHSGRGATFPLKMVDDIDGSRTNINGKSKCNVLAKMHLWNKLEYCDCRAAIQRRFIHIVASYPDSDSYHWLSDFFEIIFV